MSGWRERLVSEPAAFEEHHVQVATLAVATPSTWMAPGDPELWASCRELFGTLIPLLERWQAAGGECVMAGDLVLCRFPDPQGAVFAALNSQKMLTHGDHGVQFGHVGIALAHGKIAVLNEGGGWVGPELGRAQFLARKAAFSGAVYATESFVASFEGLVPLGVGMHRGRSSECGYHVLVDFRS